MDNQQAESFEKIRQQFDSAPFPSVPLEQSPTDDYNTLFLHNFLTAYYLRNHKITTTEGKVILDAGCGTGYKSLVLATANPGARVVGIDLSGESIELAKQRLEFYGFENTEFIVGSIEDLPNLGLEFDYINCDEVLYLIPDMVRGLEAMKAVLKPDGIIRTNLHSALQRSNIYRAQQVFKLMGLMDSNPEELEVEITRETFRNLKDSVKLKVETWNPVPAHIVGLKERILANYLLQGDKGSTIADLFSLLQDTELELINMVNWRQWELLDLFEDPDDLPAFWAMSLPEATLEQRLQLYELFNPVHRLLDFWCGHPGMTQANVPATEWSEAEWQTVTIHLHPQLRSSAIQQDLIHCIQQNEPFVIGNYIPVEKTASIYIKTPIAACLLPLWEGPQPIQTLVERSLKVSPFDPVTLDPTTYEQAMDAVINVLLTLETRLYVLLERQ